MIEVLVLGAGSRKGLLRPIGKEDDEIHQTRVDNNLRHHPDIFQDLNETPWRWLEEKIYDEIHAYEIFEHLGQQGDAQSFFDVMYECWRRLKPGGLLIGTVPRWDTLWAWGDPSHTRIINEGTLHFLDQTNYAEVGDTPMSDFRNIWHGDFKVEVSMLGELLLFKLEAVKPARKVGEV